MTEFFCREGNAEYGPLSADDLRALAASGQLTAAGAVRKGRAGNWVPATNVQGLFPSNAESAESRDADNAAAGTVEKDVEPFEELALVAAPEPLVEPAEAAAAGIDEAERYPGLRLVALYYKTASLVVGVVGIVAGFGIVIWSLSNGVRWPALIVPMLWGVLLTVGGAILAIGFWSIAELIRLLVDLELNSRRAASGVLEILRRQR